MRSLLYLKRCNVLISHRMDSAVLSETGQLREAHQFPNETVELALAHTIKNKAEAVQTWRSAERRRGLMERWTKYMGAEL